MALTRSRILHVAAALVVIAGVIATGTLWRAAAVAYGTANPLLIWDNFSYDRHSAPVLDELWQIDVDVRKPGGKLDYVKAELEAAGRARAVWASQGDPPSRYAVHWRGLDRELAALEASRRSLVEAAVIDPAEPGGWCLPATARVAVDAAYKAHLDAAFAQAYAQADGELRTHISRMAAQVRTAAPAPTCDA